MYQNEVSLRLVLRYHAPMTKSMWGIGITVAILCAIGIMVSSSLLYKDAPVPANAPSVAESSIPTPSRDERMVARMVFDATSTIPGTDIIVAYPSGGFYDLGAFVHRKISHTEYVDFLGGISVDTNPSLTATAYQKIYLSVNTTKRRSSDISIADLEKRLLSEGIEMFYPTIVARNGHEYLVYTSGESSAIQNWYAVSLGKDVMIDVLFQIWPRAGSLSTDQLKANEELFSHILSQIQFE